MPPNRHSHSWTLDAEADTGTRGKSGCTTAIVALRGVRTLHSPRSPCLRRKIFLRPGRQNAERRCPHEALREMSCSAGRGPLFFAIRLSSVCNMQSSPAVVILDRASCPPCFRWSGRLHRCHLIQEMAVAVKTRMARCRSLASKTPATSLTSA